jgi:membrane protease YdiL (CAAX protease family)
MQLVVLSIPSLVYIAVQKQRGKPWKQVLSNLGWQGFQLTDLLWGLGVLAVLALLAWGAFQIIPSGLLQGDSVSTAQYAGWQRNLTSFLLAWLREAFYVALGEEIFFRGLLGGWLVRRWGFAVGNTAQALIFLLPHLFLLTLGLAVWPILIVQLIAGWLLGWLRYRSGSILPAWLVHSLTNAFGALRAMTG